MDEGDLAYMKAYEFAFLILSWKISERKLRENQQFVNNFESTDYVTYTYS